MHYDDLRRFNLKSSLSYLLYILYTRVLDTTQYFNSKNNTIWLHTTMEIFKNFVSVHGEDYNLQKDLECTWQLDYYFVQDFNIAIFSYFTISTDTVGTRRNHQHAFLTATPNNIVFRFSIF